MKRLLTLLTSFSLLSSTTAFVVACNEPSTPSTSTSQSYPSSQTYVSTRTNYVDEVSITDGIIKDVESKKDNGNVAVYFLKRNAAFVGVQSLLSLTNNLQEGKTVYYSLSQNISQSDANGEEGIDYDALQKVYPDTFNLLRTNNNKTYIVEEDLKTIFEAIGDKKIDLYFEDFQLFDAADAQVSLVEQMLSYLDKINSITLTTDGTSQLDFEKRSQVWLKGLTSSYHQELTEIWQEIISGSGTQINKQYYFDLDKMLPTLLLNNNSGSKFVTAWATSAQICVDSLEQPHTWNQMSTGLASAFARLTSINQNLFKKIYHINDVNLKVGRYTIHAGNLIKDQPDVRVDAEANNIIGARATNPTNNIIYKPHPREDEKYYDLLIAKVAEKMDLSTAEVKEWLTIARAKTPLEVFALTGVYKSHNNLSFEYSVTGTSTSVLALYEAGSKADIINYVFSDQNQLDYFKKVYGNTDGGVVDWSKASF